MTESIHHCSDPKAVTWDRDGATFQCACGQSHRMCCVVIDGYICGEIYQHPRPHTSITTKKKWWNDAYFSWLTPTPKIVAPKVLALKTKEECSCYGRDIDTKRHQTSCPCYGNKKSTSAGIHYCFTMLHQLGLFSKGDITAEQYFAKLTQLKMKEDSK